jgi:hypothetical protein
MPFASSCRVQRATRSTATGRALAVPIAKPRFFAVSSSAASSASIAAACGTASSTISARAAGVRAFAATDCATERAEEPSSRKARPRPPISRRIGKNASSSEVKRAPMKFMTAV